MHTTEFPLLASGPLPQNHGFTLLGALSDKHPFLHGRSDLQIAPVYGSRSEDSRTIFINSQSVLRVRGLTAEEEEIMQHSQIDLQGTTLQLGEPLKVPLVGVPNLAARLVVLAQVWDSDLDKMVPFTKDTTVEQFMLTVARRVNDPQAGFQNQRKRSITIKGKNYIGWSIRLSGLSPAKSIELQMRGLGKFTSMGCGYFVGL